MRFAVVVAAGQGRRMGFKKQFMDLAGRPMWMRSVEAMFDGGADHVVVVTSDVDVSTFQSTIEKLDTAHMNAVTIVPGGATRHESVQAGMRFIWDTFCKGHTDKQSIYIAVHDAARPFVVEDDVRNSFQGATETGASVLGRACRDTVKWVTGSVVDHTIPREQLFLAETPQVVRGDLVEDAYFHPAPVDTPTDDSALLESRGIQVVCVESTSYNGKVTTPADLDYAEWLANQRWGGKAT